MDEGDFYRGMKKLSLTKELILIETTQTTYNLVRRRASAKATATMLQPALSVLLPVKAAPVAWECVAASQWGNFGQPRTVHSLSSPES